jgi:hypothetical protein
MTRFVIPMPGWSASMVAPSDHRGFFNLKSFVCVFLRFVGIVEPTIHHLTRLFDALLRVRRK